jgi:hypothetical protein
MRYFAFLLIIGVAFSMFVGPQPIRPGVGNLPSSYRPYSEYPPTQAIVAISDGISPTGNSATMQDGNSRPITNAGIGRGIQTVSPDHQPVSAAVDGG